MLFTWSLRGLTIVAVASFLSFLLHGGWRGVEEPLPAALLFQSRSSHGNDANLENKPTIIKSCLNPNGPQPLILMALGRSGSGSTYQIIGNLTGMETPSEEYTGSTPNKSRRFFNKIQDDDGLWAADNLCEKQEQYPTSGLIGFKWKPWKSIFSDPAVAGLRFIAMSRNPTIKVVRLRRNLLDVFISTQKHRQGGFGKGHCATGDEKCLKKHLLAGTNMTIPIDETLAHLKEMTLQENNVDALLDDMKVPHVHVTYEKLYHENNAEEWRRIFEFFGVGPAQNLTWEHVKGAMNNEPTSSGHHRDSVANFDELKEALQGTGFEDLLHP